MLLKNVDHYKFNSKAKLPILIILILFAAHGLFLIYAYGMNKVPEEYMVNISMDCLGMIMLCFMYYSLSVERNKDKSNQSFSLLLISSFIYLYSDELCWIVDNKSQYRTINIGANTVYYLVGILTFACLCHFVYAWTNTGKAWEKELVRLVDILSVFASVMVIGNLFGGYYFKVTAQGDYYRSDLYYISLIWILVIMIITSIYIVRNKISIKEKLVLMSFMAFPCVMSLITIHAQGPTLQNIEVFCSVVFIYSIVYVKRSEENAMKEMRLKEMEMQLLISQIHPHFISNTMTMIRSLYRMQSEDAENALNAFVRFLQINYSGLNQTVPIEIDLELEYVKQFLILAKLRWPDISVQCQYEAEDFEIPAMSIQPLVENAFTHGMKGSEKDFALNISTYSDLDCNYVIVEDNGVGFDVNNIEYDPLKQRQHIGLENVKHRVENMCDGQLLIESEAGKGTKITIKLPKKG